MTDPTTPPAPDAARREAEIEALEAAIVAAVTAGLAAQVAAVARTLRDAVRLAVTDPAGWRSARSLAASSLRRIRPDVAAQVTRLLPRAAQLGARQAGGALPDSHVPGGDDLTRQALDTVDRDTAGRLARAADQLVDGRVDTLAQLEHVLDRADAAVSHAGTVAGDAAAREVAAGLRATAAEQGMDLVIVAERDACFVTSTPVLAPSVLIGGPLGASVEVSSDPLHWFPLNPTAPSVGEVSNPCHLTASTVAGSVRDRLRNVQAVTTREYVGDVVTVETSDGNQLTGTPNHPIATRGGWVALGELQVGDYVVCRVSGERVLGGIHPDDDHTPPTIQEVADSFSFVASIVPTAAEDFHGDGSGSKVHVVRTDGLLMGDGDGSLGKERSHVTLRLGDTQPSGLDCACGPNLRAKTSRPVDGLNPVASKVPLHPRLAATVAQGDVSDGFSVGVTPSDIVPVWDRQKVPTEAILAHPEVKSPLADSEGFSDLLLGLPGVMELRQIVSARRSDFRGQVLNLQTRQGWYIASGIVVHNCLSCQSMAGAISRADGGMFRPVRVYTNRLMPWLRDGVETVPLHRRCRCRVAVATPGLADGLRREAERSVARGQSAYDSLPARLRAVDRVLAAPGSSRLPKSVRDRAARDRARGEFSRRDQRPARKAG